MRVAVLKASISAALFAIAAMPAGAVPVVATSYDLPNGSGTASGGTFNYWDLAYSGAGATNVDGALLSGGVGDLTDGVVAGDIWFNVENGAGTGPYVGWREGFVTNPVVTFNFAGTPAIDLITIHLDNSGTGGVFAPSSILVDGVATPFVAPSPGSIGTVSLAGLSLAGASHTIEFVQSCPGCWVFVSEIGFEDSVGLVPEPASWAMLATGFAVFGMMMRRRRPDTAKPA